MKLTVLLLAGAFAGFVLYLLSQQTSCDSAYRHCPVPPETLARFMGEWCNAPSLERMGGPVREHLRTDGERIILSRRAVKPGATEEVVRIRFVVDTGLIQFREYDMTTDAPLPGRMTTLMPDNDRRVVRYADGEAVFLRCERMAALGVPDAIRARF
jgi:hypothetical protein